MSFLVVAVFIMSKVRKLRDTDLDFTDLGDDEDEFDGALEDPFATTVSLSNANSCQA